MRAIPQIALVFLLAACGRDQFGTGVQAASAARPFATADTATSAPPPFEAKSEVRAAPERAAQKLIRTADLRLRVKAVPSAIRLADSIVTSRGGLVADSRLTDPADGGREAVLQVRVPADRFQETMKALETLGDVDEESVSTQDVMRDYMDLETRLAVKQETVDRMRALLANRTGKLSDVLEVERELGRQIAELEVMKGQWRFYDQQVAMSSISLTLIDASQKGGAVTTPIRQALRESLGVLGRSVAAIVYAFVFLGPWLLLLSLVFWLARRSGIDLSDFWRHSRPGQPAD